MPENEFVRLEAFDSETEALHVKGVLEDNAFEVRISGLDPSALGIDLDGPGAIELFVSHNELEKCEALLDSIEETIDDPIPAWTCACGAEVDEGFGVCWSCGAEYGKPA